MIYFSDFSSYKPAEGNIPLWNINKIMPVSAISTTNRTKVSVYGIIKKQTAKINIYQK